MTRIEKSCVFKKRKYFVGKKHCDFNPNTFPVLQQDFTSKKTFSMKKNIMAIYLAYATLVSYVPVLTKTIQF